MLTEFKAKKDRVIKQYEQLRASNSLTLFRIYTFLLSSHGRKKTIQFLWKVLRFFLRKLIGYKPKHDRDYLIWLKKNSLKREDIELIHKKIDGFVFKPKLSILLPTYNSNLEFLEKAILSVKNQYYTNWEICISDDNSTDENVKQ